MIETSARIYIQVRETGEIIQLDDFVSINTTQSIKGDSTASIVIVNKADKWYNFRSTKDRKQTDVAQLLANTYTRPLFKDINRAIAEKSKQVYKDAVRAEETGNVKYVTNSDALREMASLEEYLIFDLMYRVWVDFRGRDNLYEMAAPPAAKTSRPRWYAGFTGIITTMNESYTAGRESSLIVSAQNMLQLFRTTKAVTDRGFKPLMEGVTDVKASYQAYTNSFSQFVDGGAIIGFLATLVMRTFQSDEGTIYGGPKLWTLPEVEMVAKRGKGFIPSEKIGLAKEWINDILKREYRGVSHRRPETGLAGMSSSESFLSNLTMKDFYENGSLRVKKSDIIRFLTGPAVSAAVEHNDDNVMQYLQSSFLIDAMLRAQNTTGDIDSNPYQQMIKNGFEFESQRLSADNIMRAVANLMNYDVYFDAKGNLIYQKARYDDFPGQEADVDYDEMNEESRGYAFIDGDGNPNSRLFYKLGKGRFDRSSGLYFHGRNYIIGDESLMSWNISHNEHNVLTHVVVPQALNFLTISQALQAMGPAGTVSHPDLERKFGTRMATGSALLTNTLNTQLAELLAEGILRRSNATLESATVTLNTRPDLQLGRTMYLAERRRLYYITSITNRLVWGHEFRTTVEGAYGHHPTSPIGDPWSLVMNGDKFMPSFGPTSGGASLQDQQTATAVNGPTSGGASFNDAKTALNNQVIPIENS